METNPEKTATSHPLSKMRKAELIEKIVALEKTEISLQNSMDHLQSDLELKQAKVEEQQKEISELIEMINDLEETNMEQGNKINELKDKMKMIESSRDENQKIMDNLKANLAQKTSELEQNLELNQKLDQEKLAMEEKLASLQKNKLTETLQNELLTPEKISKSKSSFRIDMYHPGQGHYRGKIKKLLSKESEPFSGVDKEKIYDFIHKHLPLVEEKKQKPEKIDTAHQKANTSIAESDKTEAILATIPNLTQERPLEPTAIHPKSGQSDPSLSLPIRSKLIPLNMELNTSQTQMSQNQELVIRLAFSEEEWKACIIGATFGASGLEEP